MGTIIAAGENKERLNKFVPMKLSDTLVGSNTTESYRSAWDFLQTEVNIIQMFKEKNEIIFIFK